MFRFHALSRYFCLPHFAAGDSFRSTGPSPEAIQAVIDYIETNGKFDDPLVLSDQSVLLDGYAQYAAAMQLQIERVPITNKPKAVPPVPKPVEPSRQKVGTLASPSIKPERPIPPRETWGSIPLAEIVVPEGFLKTPPNPKKVQEVIEYIETYKQFDKPLFINESNRLVDGYKRYVAAKELQLLEVPVIIEWG